jgi:hypothetical protein
MLTAAQDQEAQVIVDATNLAIGNLASLHGELQQPQIGDIQKYSEEEDRSKIHLSPWQWIRAFKSRRLSYR